MNNLTQMIEEVGAGNQQSRDALFSAAYSELKKLACSLLRDGGRNTVLETTALVHESCLRFLKSAGTRRPISSFAAVSNGARSAGLAGA